MAADKLPPLERYTLSELGQLTNRADEYLNSPGGQKSHRRRAIEVIEQLNKYIQPHYLHQPISIYGIHKKTALDNKGEIQVYLKNGALEGISQGFIVLDFDEDFDDIAAKKSIRQADLLANLKEFAPGRYAVGHLVNLTSIRRRTSDYLLEQSLITRGFAPAYANELFMLDDAVIPTEEEEDEAKRIWLLSSPSVRRLFEVIEQQIRESGDAISCLARNARKFRGMNRADQYAFCKIVNTKFTNEVIGRKYIFQQGLPLYFQDNGNSGPNRIDEPCEIFLTGINQGPHYEVDWEDQIGKLTEESALYLVGYLVQDGEFNLSPLAVPLEKLDGITISSSDEQ